MTTWPTPADLLAARLMPPYPTPPPHLIPSWMSDYPHHQTPNSPQLVTNFFPPSSFAPSLGSKLLSLYRSSALIKCLKSFLQYVPVALTGKSHAKLSPTITKTQLMTRRSDPFPSPPSIFHRNLIPYQKKLSSNG
ncbi:unnamed protein product [Arabidopsis halleri]